MSNPRPRLPVLVLSDDIQAQFDHPALVLMRFSDWQGQLLAFDDRLILDSMPMLGMCLSPEAEAAFQQDVRLTELADAAEIPRKTVPTDATVERLMSAALEFFADRDADARSQNAEDRAALAELRRSHMQMQTDHAELEGWIWEALAPKYRRVREWPVSAATLSLPGAETPLRQPLPVPARGFIAVDVHLAASAPSDGAIHFVLSRPTGQQVEATRASYAIGAGDWGWVRLSVPRAPGGFPEDTVLTLWWEGAGTPPTLSFAPDTPFPDLAVTQGTQTFAAPLALRVYQTLPRQPAPPLYDPRRGLPADGQARLLLPSDLQAPQQLPYTRGTAARALKRYPDYTQVDYWAKENAVFVHPSAHRPVVALVPGVTVEGLRQISAIGHVYTHQSLPISFAVGGVAAGAVGSVEEALEHLGDWVELLPKEWGEVWCDLPEDLSGPVDLLLATAMPNMPYNRNADALFKGIRLVGRRQEGSAPA